MGLPCYIIWRRALLSSKAFPYPAVVSNLSVISWSACWKYVLSYWVKALERGWKLNAGLVRPPGKLCVHVCVHAHRWKYCSSLRRRYKRSGRVGVSPISFFQGNCSPKNEQNEKYSMYNWALLLGHNFLSSPYNWYMSQKLASTQRAHMSKSTNYILSRNKEAFLPETLEMITLARAPWFHLLYLLALGSSQK